MRTVRSRQGPFQQRPHFSIREIEEICSDVLRATGLLPSEPEPIRIERFIEKHFGVVPQYEELPRGVLGFTQFGEQTVKSIVLSKEFESTDIDRKDERRLRTTLAHEAGHGIMHARLFTGAGKPASLFDDDHAAPEILCRDVEGVRMRSKGYDGRWWEFQANKAIGALLLPRDLARLAVQSLLQPRGLFGEMVLPEPKRELAAQTVASVFDVNPAVARIRLNDIFDPKDYPQLSL